MKRIIFILFLSFLFLQVYSQLRIGDFMAYGNNSGLPVSLYYTVFQSSDGYLWMGSSSGLVRFDGKRYKIFFSDYTDTNSIADNIIVDIEEDNEQNLWLAGFVQGLTKYNLRTGIIKRYSHPSDDDNTGFGINELFKDNKDQIWIGTAGRGLARYVSEKDSFEFFFPDPLKPADGSNRLTNHIRGIAPDRADEDILWLACFDGLYSFNKRTKIFQHYIFFDPDKKNTPLSFLSVETDLGPLIWLGTWYDGLISFDKISHQFETYIYPEASPPNSIHYQVLDLKSIDDSTLYIASRNSGLLSFNTKTSKIHPLLTNQMLPGGLSGIDIQRINITPDAGIFVGGNYYIYQQHKSFNRFGHSTYLNYEPDFSVFQIVHDSIESGYWASCSSARGVLYFTEDMATNTLYKSENKLDLHYTDLAVDRSQNVWVVNPSSGLKLLDKEDHIVRKINHKFPGLDTLARHVNSIETDQEGNLWLLTRKNLYHFDVRTFALENFKLFLHENFDLNNLSLCCGQNHDAWVGSDFGLFHCIPQENKIIHLVPDDVHHKSIANVFIKSMTVDKSGNAWLGFESDGVQIVSAADHHIMASYNLDDGLPGMQINQMATDTAGRIWVGTAAGLALFNPNSSARVWQLFNREDGIRRDYIDRPIMTTDDGKLFFNIEGGISWIDIGVEQTLQNRRPLLHLTSLIVDGKAYRKDLLPDYLTSIELPYSSREINIEYAAMDWLHPTRTKYFYRLDGISQSKEWIENNQATLTLTGMKSGTYLLRLYAVSGDGIKSREIQLPLIIHPPFWLRWWFLSLCVLSAILFGYGIYLYRIGQLKKLQAMRNTISRNLHDDIGASLSNIHILTVLTQRNISDKENATSYITKAGDEIQRISESLSDIVWNISPKYDELDNLFIRMKRYAADMLDGKNIKAQFVFPKEHEKLSMPMDQRRDFYLIFKEAVNNLVKYSGASEAIVKVEIDQRIIRLCVSDNGQGYDESQIISGNGIQNMKQRAEKWKSVLLIKSKPKEGTNIELEMRVN